MGRRSNPEVLALALGAYVPFLLSDPGRVSADSKQALYLDPGGLLARAGDLWDPSIGAGTVPHQQLGYLLPAGPWFWVFDRVGIPDWVAQRLWLGSLTLVALLGARWLFGLLGTGRAGALAGAVVYGFTPYQLAFTARMSVLLLPWAALPWLLGLTIRATRGRGWRAPALLALVLLATGGVNASSLLLVAIGPVVWVVCDAARGGGRTRAALVASAWIGILAGGICAWWLVGIRLQGAYGLPVLQLTENLPTVAEASTPGDVLRGLGNWFFYGRDRTGYSIDQASDYADDGLVVALSFAVPALALAAAAVLRWTHRTFFVVLVVVGTVVAVGSWPHADPSPYGRLWRTFTTETSAGLALRNSPRAVPVIVLGLAGLLAAAVGAVGRPRWRAGSAALVGLLGVAALLPVWEDGYLTDRLTRPEDLPAYWEEVAAALDADGGDTRVLEIPGSSFAAYRWGTTTDPVTPSLIERPYLAREVLPDGGPATANLLAALDRRMQLGTFEPAGLAPLARLLGVGTVALRADLERSGRFETPEVEALWAALTGGAATGLDEPVGFGPPGGGGDDPTVPSVGLFEVDDAVPIVHTAPVERPVVLGGDAEGVVDAAAAGLLDGRTLVLMGTALSPTSLDRVLDDGADLVLTDSHRRRAETWFYSIRDNRGPTERVGETQPDPTGYDFRLPTFPGAGDDSRTVAEHLGATVVATAAGGPERPEDRAVHGVDGDPTTAWRVGGPDPRGASITIVPDEPRAVGSIHLVQPRSGTGRAVSRVAVRVPGRDPVLVDLGPASLTPEGQSVDLAGSGAVERLEIEILDTSPPSPTLDDGSPVGLAEVRLDDLTAEEVIRLPLDLLARVGSRLDEHGLDVVLTRLRQGVPTDGRGEEEPRLDRRFELPAGRSFAVSAWILAEGGVAGLGSVPAGAPATPCRDDLLRIDDVPVPLRIAASGAGVRLESCTPIALGPGSHRVESSGPAAVLDRVVLSSGLGGMPADIGHRGAPIGSAGTTSRVQRHAPGEVDVEVESGSDPFWLVLGESHSDGWEITVDGGEAGTHELANGFANGWIITPDQAGTVSVALRWSPQRAFPVGVAVSAVTLLACLAIVWRTRRQPRPDVAAAPELAVPE
ncbi:MAG: alpha-(1-_3)-arabinofuranosyltransferase domain-containing protein, partial [Acidimicrobiales bacterium]